MKILQHIAWWGLKRVFLLRIEPKQNSYEACLQYKQQVKAEVSSESLEALQVWMRQQGKYPIWIQFVLDEVAVGEVENGKSPIESVLGVQVPQPSLFWLQEQKLAHKSYTAVIRKSSLEVQLSCWEAFEHELIGFSIFPGNKTLEQLQQGVFNQPKQLNRQKNTYKLVNWTIRLALAVTCCSLAASLCFSLMRHDVYEEMTALRQQTIAYRPLLDSIQQNDSILTLQLKHLQLQKQLKPSAFSYFIDQIAAIAPAHLQFEQLILQPDQKDRKRIDQKLKHEDLGLILTGEATEASHIANFSQALNALPFIEQASLLETPFDPAKQAYYFRIIGTLKP